MPFNTDRNKQVVELPFSQKRIKTAHAPLYFNNQEVVSTSHHKHLGLILDSKLSSRNILLRKFQQLVKVLEL